MEAVLGFSVTSSSVGWVLLDGPGVDAAALDHDVFDVAGSSDDHDISKHIAALRGALSIAAASGHELKSIGLTWTPDAAATANLLLSSLPELGFVKVASVRLSEAVRTWAYVYGEALGFEKAAVCVVEPAAATVLSFGYGAVRTFATPTRESDDGLSRWLKDAFETNHLDPEHLFLIGSRGDLELIAGRLRDALPMPVVTSGEAQLVLARGAALAARPSAATTAIPLAVKQIEAPPQTLGQKLSWFSPPARAAVVLVASVVALFILGPELVSQPEPPSAADQAASSSSTTSVRIQAVPAPVAAPSPTKVVQRLAQAAPPPVAEVMTREAPVTVEQLAVPETPAAVVPEVPVALAAEAPDAVMPATEPDVPVATELAEVAHLPEPADVAHLPAQPAETPHLAADADVPSGTAHLPDAGTLHLPGAVPGLAAEAPVTEPVLAAEAPVVEPSPTFLPPTRTASSAVWAALP